MSDENMNKPAPATPAASVDTAEGFTLDRIAEACASIGLGDSWFEKLSIELLYGAPPAAAQQHAQAAQPIEVDGLGSITNEDDGVLTLRFKDDDAAQSFFRSHQPTVDCRDMPRPNLVEDDSRVTGHAQAALSNRIDRIDLLHGAYITRETKTTGANGWLLRNEHGLVRALDAFEREFVDCSLSASQQPAAAPAECGACHGSGWMVRDADIGTEQECSSCDGSGHSEEAAPSPVQREVKS